MSRSGLWGAAAAVLSAASLAGCNGDDGSTEATCQIGTTALGLVVAAVTHGRAAEDIGAFVNSQGGGILLSSACEELAVALSTDPAQQFEFELELPSGGIEDESVSGMELLGPPPPPPLTSLADCLDWDGAFLVQLCFDGVIDPPVD